MAGRRSVWSNPKIIALTQHFVPAADEVWRLQQDDDPECRAFRRMVRGDERVRGGTMQGTYIFSPGGKLLARRNSNSPIVMATIIESALDRWRNSAETPAPTTPPAAVARARWEDSFPTDGLALTRTVRDLPSSGDANDRRAVQFNRDAAWFSAQEARSWLPDTPRRGALHPVPQALVDRLARLVLVDNARGQTIPYAPSEVIGSRIRSKVTAVEGKLVSLELSGVTHANALGPWLLGESYWKPRSEFPHSLVTQLRGAATFDLERGRFTAFEILALGWRQGRTVMNARGRDPSPGHIGFVLELAPPGWRIAPTFINLYDVDWVRHPNSPRAGRWKSYSVIARVKTTESSAEFPAFLTDKDWAGGDIKDYTTHHALGRSRTTGTLRGFALALQPDGAWSWNVGDGKHRLDYRATAPRQKINDGKSHLLAFAMDDERNECRLYRDGRRVATYSVSGFATTRSGAALRSSPMTTSVELQDVALRDDDVAALWRNISRSPITTGAAADRVKTLRVLAWNIWHGGRRDGNEAGLAKTIDAIRASRADVICMQETYGSGAAIADALGFHFYLRSTNLSVMSRYPIVDSHDLYQPFRFGGVTLELSPGQRIKVFSLWINHLPSVAKGLATPDITADKLVAADDATRGKEVRGILATLEPHTRGAGTIPLIVAGDFNSPSHLDWTQATAARNQGLVVPWPVSRAMTRHGFIDAYRTVHGDPASMPGRTWSPRFRDTLQQRIDYVYFKGPDLTPRTATVLDRHQGGWPSDHAGVIVEFGLE